MSAVDPAEMWAYATAPIGDPEHDKHREHEPEVRWFWWPAAQLTYRWRPFVLGGDEWMRRTLGVRLPGGMAFLCLWRFRDAVGPCMECGQWESREFWPPKNGGKCPTCRALDPLSTGLSEQERLEQQCADPPSGYEYAGGFEVTSCTTWNVWECTDCGALVENLTRHDAWHARQGQPS